MTHNSLIKIGDEYEVQIKNIRKSASAGNDYVIWKTFMLDGGKLLLLMSHTMRHSIGWFILFKAVKRES